MPSVPTPRNPVLELLVERAAAAVSRAKQRHDAAEVRARIDAAVSAEDAETTARVLRIVAREFGDAGLDLDTLDARLRALATPGGEADADDSDTPANTRASSPADTPADSPANTPANTPGSPGPARPIRPRGGLRTPLTPRRR